MKFDKWISVLREEKVPDGMGGWEVERTGVIDSFQSFMTPVSAEMLLKEHGIVSTHAMKIFTKDKLLYDLPDKDMYLQYLDKNYKILQFNDYGKYKMLLVEVF